MSDRRSTDALIRSLAASAPPAPFPAAGMIGAVTGCAALAVAAFLAVFGARPDLVEALAAPPVLAKSLLPVALAGLALWLALRSARPGLRLPLWPLAVPVSLAVVLFAGHLIRTPPEAVLPAVMGHTATACLLSITGLSLPAIIAGIALVRRGAAIRPTLTGALTGIAASACVAAGYALHCNEDSPLFFTVWYGLAILIGGVAGAGLGRRFLRW